MIGRGSLGSLPRVIHSATSTSLLELDKLHDHVTHDVRHSKHFKKQRKPYLFKIIKKPRKSFDFEATHELSMTLQHTHQALDDEICDMHLAWKNPG